MPVRWIVPHLGRAPIRDKESGSFPTLRFRSECGVARPRSNCPNNASTQLEAGAEFIANESGTERYRIEASIEQGGVLFDDERVTGADDRKLHYRVQILVGDRGGYSGSRGR